MKPAVQPAFGGHVDGPLQRRGGKIKAGGPEAHLGQTVQIKTRPAAHIQNVGLPGRASRLAQLLILAQIPCEPFQMLFDGFGLAAGHVGFGIQVDLEQTFAESRVRPGNLLYCRSCPGRVALPANHFQDLGHRKLVRGLAPGAA